MLDVFVGKFFASRALGELHAFTQSAVICFGVGCVERFDGKTAFDANWHCGSYMARLVKKKEQWC